MASQSLLEEKSRSEEMKKKLPRIKNGNAEYYMGLRQQLQIIRDKVTTNKFVEDPVHAVIEINAREARRTVRDLRGTITPMKLSPSLEAEARAQAKELLSSNPAPSMDVEGFQEGRSAESEAREREELRQRVFDAQNNRSRFNYNEEERDRLVQGLGIDPGSDEGRMIKECIPCGFRKLSLDDIEFSNPFAATMEDLKRKLERLKNLLDSLFMGQEFEQDLCELLKMFNAQCIPDLFGIISLLGIMQSKYLSSLDMSWKNALNALIAPFLQPIIGPFTHNLERYVDMITDPLTCVVQALEAQMFKLDVVGAVDNVKAQRVAFNRKKMEFYDRKVDALERRKRTILSEYRELNSSGELGNNQDIEMPPLNRLDTTQPVNAKYRTFPRYKSTVPFSDKEFDLNTGGEALTGQPFAYRQSYEQEMEVIDRDIAAAKRERLKLKDDNNTNFRSMKGSQVNLNEALDRIDNTNRALKSIIYQVTLGINQGIQVIRDTLEMYRLELERLITGRVQNQEDQIELARNVQQITRHISIVNAIIKLKKNGWSLEEMCNGGSSTQAMGAFVGAFKTEPSGGDFDFYAATDNNGNELMVIAPGGTKVSLTSVEFDDIGEDDLFGDASINEVQNTATFNDLNEADKLNRKGVLLSLGNISDKEITIKLDDAGNKKTDLDLRAENSYVIIKNDFCSKSPIKGTSDTVRQWAENL